MTRPVEMLRDGDVAILRIDNPPVNALSHAVRVGLMEGLQAVDRDEGVRAVVIACAGRTFVAGADIKEFGKPRQAPWLTDVIDAIENFPKPVVAAIHGTALGGGLELALGCHARVAARDARLGLPEVKLGLLPGGGGTQRLPRAVGAVKALRMIVSGEPVTATQALDDGLVDAMADGDLTDAAVAHARSMADAGKSRRLRDEDVKLAGDRAAFEATATDLTRRARRMRAPHACVEAARAALDLPFDEGMARERALFEELMAGDQSKAQRYLFFAEREAAKLTGPAADAKPRAIARAAVIGAGTMGTGIALALADSGIRVTLLETSDEALQRGLGTIGKTYADAVKRGKLDASEAARREALIKGGIGLEQVTGAELVIEAVFEDLALKQKIFAGLGRQAGDQAILATNTSYLDVDAIAAASGRPALVAGMHFFSPANVMRLVEIVRGRETAPEVLATLVALARRLGKVPVVVGNCHGFVGNRMLRQRNIAAERLMLEGATPEQIDAAMVEFGFAMGPLAATDLAGLDIGWRMRKAAGLRAEIADALCEAGRLGQKSGRGFYRYEPGSRTPLPDPDVETLIREKASELGVAQRAMGAEEIVERLLLPMINEGARILEEGVAARASDIDVIWANGYGWPVWRGGPMHYADRLGLSTVRDRLNVQAEALADDTLRPAPMIVELAARGRTFAPSVSA